MPRMLLLLSAANLQSVHSREAEKAIADKQKKKKKVR